MKLKSIMLAALLLAVLFSGCIGDKDKVAPTPTPAPTPEPTDSQIEDETQSSDINIAPTILIILIAVCGVLAVIAIIFGILYTKGASKKKKEKSSYNIKDADL